MFSLIPHLPKQNLLPALEGPRPVRVKPFLSIPPADKPSLLRLRNVVSIFKRGRQPVGNHSPSSAAGASGSTQRVSVLQIQRLHSWPGDKGPYPVYV